MSASPLALVTCGPGHEPIDSVRRITNFSTGELGSYLCDALLAAGFSVRCLRGEMATYPLSAGVESEAFSTNDSLAELFEATDPQPAIIFHAAALCDYTLAKIEGVELSAKIRSDAEELKITLHPAAKLLPTLPRLFPDAVIVGWKYELDGNREDAIARGRSQLVKAGTQACVVNGAAYGAGFGFLWRHHDDVTHYGDKLELCRALAEWGRERLRESK